MPTKSQKKRMIVVKERPASIDCYPIQNEHIDLTKSTMFVKLHGRYFAVPQVAVTEFRPDAEIATGWGSPNLGGVETAIVPIDDVPEEYFQTVDPNHKFD
ncbi:hypothetical protein LEP3755_48370 [Leptolyngbya sp. NIES-3755]|nr:hypothetical protein LEP3755_48370 [Leptolyngbya sp. NIES-3755]